MRSIKSYIDEGFEVIVHKQSDVADQVHEENMAIGPCDYCEKGKNLLLPATLAFCGSDNKVHRAFVHDGCYVAAMCEWGLTENA